MCRIVMSLGSAAMLLAIPAAATAVQAEKGDLMVAQNEAPHATEAVLRDIIAGLRRGYPDYSRMEQGLRQAMQQQMPNVMPMFAQFGALERVEFLSTQGGIDVYRVTFANGVTRWTIGLSAAGKVETLFFRPDVASTVEPIGEDVGTAGLSGTLVRPASVAGSPVVLLIAGSGPTDRNGNQFGAGPGELKQLAELLAQRGIASLRYDKRGVARSSAEGLREQDLSMDGAVDDAARWIAWLEQRSDLGPRVVAGHSEGGVIGILLAKRAAIAGLVLLATPGRPLGDVMRDQFRRVGWPQPVLDEALTTLAALERGESVGNVSPALLPLFRPSVQPFLRSALGIRPAHELNAVTVPVLIVSGGQDTQVGMVDADALAKARPDAAELRIPAMNHVLMRVRAGQGAQETPSDALAPGLVEKIASFVNGLPR